MLQQLARKVKRQKQRLRAGGLYRETVPYAMMSSRSVAAASGFCSMQ